MPIIFPAGGGTGGGGGGSGTVTNVSSADTSIAVTNPTTTPSLKVATLDVIATNEPAAAAVPLNGQKITGIANGAAASDAAAFGQIPAALPPNGAAGGDLSGTYPNPKVSKITETSGPTDLTIGTLADGQFLKRSGATLISGAVAVSVFGRTGAVVAADADYAGVVAAALTGATAATRYVGGTASGAPSSGTFAVGDFVIDQSGAVWVCTAAGTPGTWRPLNPKIAARVYNSANETIADSTVTTLTFDSERYDFGGLHSTSSNTSRLTLPIAGVYEIGATVTFAASVTGLRELRFILNGSTIISFERVNSVSSIGSVAGFTMSTQYSFAANDYVEVAVQQESGGNLDVTSGANYSPEFYAFLSIPA